MAWSHTEPGHGCPVSMTYAAVPALRADDALAKEWTPLLASTTYDPGLRPAAEKRGALAGMGMTEKQGGSDVRANVTQAVPTATDGEYTLHGHKWFTSAPMNDVFLVLAQAEGGVTCFVVPRVLPDGTRNRIDVVRLKDKLGNRSNASSELELDGHRRAPARRRGPRRPHDHRDGRRDPARLRARLGVADAARASTRPPGTSPTAPLSARLLADKPLMQNVVADLAVEAEAATALAIRLAAAVDGIDDPHEAALRRIALPLAKFWVCKRTPGHGRRGAGVPGRQRVRRGVGAAAALPRGAAQLRVGGLGQRQRPRRAAGAVARAGGARGVDHRGRAGPRRRRPARPRDRGHAARCSATTARSRGRPAGWPAGWRPASRGRCWCASRPPRSPTRSAARASARRTTGPTARSPAATCATIVERATPTRRDGTARTPGHAHAPGASSSPWAVEDAPGSVLTRSEVVGGGSAGTAATPRPAVGTSRCYAPRGCQVDGQSTRSSGQARAPGRADGGPAARRNRP